ncbi:MAG: hypothetical protein PVH41_11580 [Anaerolineae bacterium]|jgi:hypothetical protein
MRLREFVREYAVELIAGFLAFLGVFLLVERMEIRVTILRLLRLGWRAVSGTLEALAGAVVYRVVHITTSDLLGLVLIALAIAVVLWRLRVRLMERYAGRTCPLCGGNLRRRHRRWSDRVMSLLVPVNRYRCRNSECQWEGLRATRDQ